MNDIFNSLIKSRRFWAAVASIIVVVFKDRIPLTEEQITTIVMGIYAWIVGESIRSSQAVKVGLIAGLLFCFAMPSAEAAGPVRRLLSRSVSIATNVTARTQVAIQNTAERAADKYQTALASAQYRAANRIRGHVPRLELLGGIRSSGVGYASHDPNPATCLGRPGSTSATCAVVRGPDGWYSTCVQ